MLDRVNEEKRKDIDRLREQLTMPIDEICNMLKATTINKDSGKIEQVNHFESTNFGGLFGLGNFGVGKESEHSTGLKHDSGKPIAGVLFEDFPMALSGVADIATFGANKYERNSWRNVDNAHQRYSDALVRHMLAKGKGEVNDPESGMPHSWHIAWNALALIELEKCDAR